MNLIDEAEFPIQTVLTMDIMTDLNLEQDPVSCMNLGLDLSLLNIDQFDINLYNNNNNNTNTYSYHNSNINSTTNISSFNNLTNEIQIENQNFVNSSDNLLKSNNNNNNNDINNLNIESAIFHFESNENLQQQELDFVLLGNTNLLFNQTHTCSENNLDLSLIDLVNSPSNEITYLDVSTIEPCTSIEDDISIMSNSTLSPSGSNSDNTEIDYVPTKANRRTRSRPIDKKESNKAAAVRYRNKKLKERDELFSECQIYSKKNAEMKQMILDCQTEISFIKSLLVEALIVKSGLAKN